MSRQRKHERKNRQGTCLPERLPSMQAALGLISSLSPPGMMAQACDPREIEQEAQEIVVLSVYTASLRPARAT